MNIFLLAVVHRFSFTRQCFPCCKKIGKFARTEHRYPFKTLQRDYSSEINKYDERKNNTLQTTVVNIKETTKNIGSFVVVVLGFGLVGVVFYTVYAEIFARNSTVQIYTRAYNYVAADPRVQALFGADVKGHGEESSRRRRQHVTHAIYEKNGIKHTRMKFYLKGSHSTGSVNLEIKEDKNGEFTYRYLFVTDDTTRKVIILEDNRHLDTETNTSKELEFTEFDFK